MPTQSVNLRCDTYKRLLTNGSITWSVHQSRVNMTFFDRVLFCTRPPRIHACIRTTTAPDYSFTRSFIHLFHRCTRYLVQQWNKCVKQLSLVATFVNTHLYYSRQWFSIHLFNYNSATGHFVWLVRSPGLPLDIRVPHVHYQRSKTCSIHTVKSNVKSIVI